MALQVQLRRDLAATWTLANPILAQGEVGCELDTNAAKLGNGVDDWNTLPYWPAVVAPTAGVAAKIQGAQVGDGSPFPLINFMGQGVSIYSQTAGTQVSVAIPGGVVVQDEGTLVDFGGTFPRLIFQGAGVNISGFTTGVSATVNIPGGSIGGAKTIRAPVGYPGTSLLTANAIPNGNYCSKVTVKVNTPFNGSGNSITVQLLTGPVSLMLAGDSDLSTVGINVVQPYIAAGADGRLVVSCIVGPGCTQGSADVFIEYIEVVT